MILIYSKMHDVQHLLYSSHTQEQCIVLELMAIKKFIDSLHYKGRELWDILLCEIFLLQFQKKGEGILLPVILRYDFVK